MFWDVRAPKMGNLSASFKKQNVDQNTQPTSHGALNAFKHLDRTWKPLFKVLQGLGCNWKLFFFFTVGVFTVEQR